MAEDKKCYKPKNFTVIRAIQLEVGNEDDVNCGNIIIIIIIIIINEDMIVAVVIALKATIN